MLKENEKPEAFHFLRLSCLLIGVVLTADKSEVREGLCPTESELIQRQARDYRDAGGSRSAQNRP